MKEYTNTNTHTHTNIDIYAIMCGYIETTLLSAFNIWKERLQFLECIKWKWKRNAT